MRERKRLDPIGTAPTIVALEIDLRVHLRINVTHLLEAGGVDSETGEPTREELEELVRATLEQFLQRQAGVTHARVTRIELEAPSAMPFTTNPFDW
jgi:hypothetical protein